MNSNGSSSEDSDASTSSFTWWRTSTSLRKPHSVQFTAGAIATYVADEAPLRFGIELLAPLAPILELVVDRL
jgi:hypothetical protein